MKITHLKDINPLELMRKLEEAIKNSRFSACFDWIEKKQTTYQILGINITTVRLRDRKFYCGSHPKGCEAPHFGPHKRLNYLEGADWVEWNDLLNDVLDELNASANISSSVCIIRKGTLRRISYEANSQFPNGTWIWDKDSKDQLDWRDNRNKGHITSYFPQGTPGLYLSHNIKYQCVG